MTEFNVLDNDLDVFWRFALAELKEQQPVNRHEWQKMDVSTSRPHMLHELTNITLLYTIPGSMEEAQEFIKPDLPWAEEHFQERVKGLPYNPPPSYMYWPHHHGNPDRHTNAGGRFDHTYPERIWPKLAGNSMPYGSEHRGVRFKYGDLNDVLALLADNLWTRQAFLPIWFPEDTGAREGQRVPCTLGYHFQYNVKDDALDMTYMIRSCDLVRHFRNDVYMAVRLQQWVADQLSTPMDEDINYGRLIMYIINLHVMVGDIVARKL